MRLWTLALVGLIGCGTSRPVEPAIGDADRAEITAALDSARSLASSRDAERIAALARGGTVPGSGTCSIHVPMPPSDAMLTGEHEEPGGRDARATQMILIDAADTTTAPGARRADVEHMADDIAAQIAPDGHTYQSAEQLLERARALSSDATWTWELDVIASEHVPGRLVGDATFDGGHVTGVAYLYSWSEHRIVCAAPVSAASSSTLPNHGAEALQQLDVDMDLANEAYRAAVRGLVPAVETGPAVAVPPEAPMPEAATS